MESKTHNFKLTRHRLNPYRVYFLWFGECKLLHSCN